ncbi:hypothetical protein AGDE_11958 [Angomonas deanei]|nr:hypothetical protein AGDE_11958 [Angomonas deanei]|eukprot:EPY25224.1 hypothetical protein AGDE_11958 [Angomonas deanei]
MSLDPTKISIISAKKANEAKLSSGRDAAEALKPKSVPTEAVREKRCSLCCMLYGGFIDAVAVASIGVAATVSSIRLEKRVNYSLNGAMRQIAWISFPGVLVGCTLHFFLSEAMWSGKHNSWGQAWAKAMVVNASLWTLAIGGATLAWRNVMPLTSAGRRLYHRYPIPTDALATRVLRNEVQLFTGMGFTYWLSGVVSGTIGLLTCVAVAAYSNRPYMFMAPQGSYASYCMPKWRRDHLESMASSQGAVVQSPEK